MRLDSLDHERVAVERDRRLVTEARTTWEVGNPRALLTALHRWLRTDTSKRSASVEKLIQLDENLTNGGTAILTCGDRKESWHQRNNGLRCHFKFVLAGAQGQPWRPVSYSFQVDRAPTVILRKTRALERTRLSNPRLRYLRYDFAESPQSDQVSHPLCHLTPGAKTLRLPTAPLTPKELASWYLSLKPW